MAESDSKDWIELFLEYTDGIPSPEIFRLWAGIATVAGALERRVWIVSAGDILYPNLYTLLVGTPGTGKTQAIKHANALWYAVKDFHVAPHDVTKAALIDRLARSGRKLVLGETKIVEYNSLLVAADEFGVLVPAHDLDFLSTLNRIYDNPPQHQQERRGLKDQIDIVNPQLNIIGGTQPAYLASLLPEEAWGMGFMSRVLMIHSAEKKRVSLFNAFELKPQTFRQLMLKLVGIARLHGRFMWELPAAHEADRWNTEGCEPVPDHSKMEHYNSRRLLHVLKLSLVSAVSAGHTAISLWDFNRARDWLIEAEQHMPDVFREMVGKSDTQVIDELHFFMWRLWAKDKKPIHESRIVNFLRSRVPSEKVNRIVDVAMRANVLERLGGTDLYQPRPKSDWGVE